MEEKRFSEETRAYPLQILRTGNWHEFAPGNALFESVQRLSETGSHTELMLEVL